MRNSKIFTMIMLTVFTKAVFAADEVSSQTAATNNTPQPSTTSTTEASISAATTTQAAEYLYCPEPSMLRKVNGSWKVSDIWKSDSPSSGKEIKEFIGAQWVGVKYGKIICLYNENEKIAFPVALLTVNPVLILSPETTYWILSKKGYKNCVSHSVYDCPFLQQNQKKRLISTNK